MTAAGHRSSLLPGDEPQVHPPDLANSAGDIEVTTSKFGTPVTYIISREKSLGLLSVENPLRKFTIDFVVTYSPFDYFIILVILVNCVFLALNDPPEAAEVVFIVIFTVEMVLKIIGRGLVMMPHAYLRDKWNWLDFIVVLLGYLALVPSVGNYSAIRVFRVFRALRAVTAIPGLRILVASLLASFGSLFNVLAIVIFVVSFAAILAVQLFQGFLRGKCVADFAEPISNQNYSLFIHNPDNWLLDDDAPQLCGNQSTSRACPADFVCLREPGQNPNEGYTNFDSFPWAVLSVFRIITLDYWEDIYNKLLETAGTPSVIFFLVLIFFGCFVLLNLVLAVVASEYLKTKQDPDVKPSPAARSTHRNEHDAHIAIPTLESRARNSFSRAATWIGTKTGPFRSSCRHIVEKPWFNATIMTCIILNTLTLAIEHPSMSDNLALFLEVCNYIFYSVFALEMLVKMFALGFRRYFHDPWNRFDCVIVTISTVEIVIALASDTSVGGLSVLRAFRLLRVFKLARRWTTMRLLVKIIGESISSLGYLILILCIIMYIFAVVGMQLFRDSYTDEAFGGEMPRWNFTDFPHSFMLIFRILCGEWIEPLWETLHVSSTGAIFFYLAVLLIGNFVTLNLFLAVLLSAFAEDALQSENTSVAKRAINSFKRSIATRLRLFRPSRVTPGATPSVMQRLSNAWTLPTSDVTEALHEDELGEEARDSELRQALRSSSGSDQDSDSGRESTQGADDSTAPIVESATASSSKLKSYDSTERLAPPTTSWRHRVFEFVRKPWFENVILLLIVWSSFMLIFEDSSLRFKPDLERVLFRLNIFFAIVFAIEALLKIVAFGIRGYFSSGWNFLDFFIVLISIAGLAASSSNLSFLRALRTLRALRPLRAISRWQGMKLVVNSLFGAIPSIFNVLLVCMLFWLVFSIIGVQFFGDKFYKCVDADGNRLGLDVVRTKSDCLALAALDNSTRWVNSKINFDHSGNGFLALFQVATFEGWMEVMEDAVDARGIDQQPDREETFAAYLFFVLFIVIGSFFTLNLFVGVVIDNFNRLKMRNEKAGRPGVLLTESQAKYVALLRKMATHRPQKLPPRPRGHFANQCYDLSMSTRFEASILVVILLNMLAFMFEHYEQSDDWTLGLFVVNVLFTVVYIAEMIIKMIGLRWRYFTSNWNRFDFAIVIVSVIGLIMDIVAASLPVNPTALRILRIFRVIRVLRIAKSAKQIRTLFLTLLLSLPALLNVGTLLLLIVFIYAVIGMNLFGNVIRNGALNEFHNFDDFGNSLLMLFRLATAAGWNDVLDACLVQAPDCDPDFEGLVNGNCGSPAAARVYFSTYVMLTFLIIVNMYVAVILENLHEASRDEDETVLSERHITEFYEIWREYDPQATQFISLDQLPELVARLPAPLGITSMTNVQIAALDFPLLEDDRMHCLDVLNTLSRHALLRKYELVDKVALDHIQESVDRYFIAMFPVRKRLVVVQTTMERHLRIRAAILIQRGFRRWRARSRAPTPRAFSRNSSSDSKNTHSPMLVPRSIPRHQALGVLRARYSPVLPGSVSSNPGSPSLPRNVPFPVVLPSFSRSASGAAVPATTQAPSNSETPV
eukprot:m.186932 g.186932  ORF g.186932 m.186932 type:complete len:1593 (-) comp10537_c4_seq1:430-5208(-)